jgi:hypothetical protein
MAQRHISESEVERTLVEYHTGYADRAGNPIFVAHIDGRRIKVVVRRDSEPPTIITVGD